LGELSLQKLLTFRPVPSKASKDQVYERFASLLWCFIVSSEAIRFSYHSLQIRGKQPVQLCKKKNCKKVPQQKEKKV